MQRYVKFAAVPAVGRATKMGFLRGWQSYAFHATRSVAEQDVGRRQSTEGKPEVRVRMRCIE